MKICVATNQVRGWDFKVAAALARLGHHICFLDETMRKAFRNFYPTVQTTCGAQPDIYLISSSINPLSLPIPSEAKSIYLVDSYNYNVFESARAQKGKAVAWVVNKDLIPLFSAAGIPTVHFGGGVEEEAFCVLPQGTLEKANWIAHIDLDSEPCPLSNDFFVQLYETFPNYRCFILSDKSETLYDFWALHRQIYFYKRTPPPSVLYPFLAQCKIVVCGLPKAPALPFLPTVAISAAQATNTYVVLVGYHESVGAPPFIFTAPSENKAIELIQELKESAPPLKTAEEVIATRRKNKLVDIVQRCIDETLRYWGVGSGA